MSAITPTASPAFGMADAMRLYFEMTRPRVLALVLFTGLPALVIGQEASPGWGVALWVLVGTALSGAACSVLNAWVERESDAWMARTRNRPLPAAAVAPHHALVLGLMLTVVSTVVLGLVGGWAAAAVGLGNVLFYVVGYTWYLKPRTPQNIVIGGAAGATAPIIVDVAMDGVIGPVGLVLFAIIFLWTPPHFWAVALYRKEEYAAARIPMMPLVVGDQGTRWRSLGYNLALLPATLVPVYLGLLGWFYAAVAVAVGLWFVGWNLKALKYEDREVDRAMFRVSIAHLTILFAAMLLDALVVRSTAPFALLASL